MNTRFEELDIPVPIWAQNSLRELGVDAPAFVRGAVPSYEDNDAPVVIEVDFATAGAWRRIEGQPVVLPIRMVGDRLFAAFPTLGDRENFTIHGPADRPIHPNTLAARLDTNSADHPFLSMPESCSVGRTSFDAVQFLRGPSIAERLIANARHRTAFINGILHVTVHEPVWRPFRLDDGAVAARICVPVDEAYMGRVSVRLDRRDEAQGFFPQCLRSRPGPPRPVTFGGEARILSSRFRYVRDDVRLTAVDLARTMLAATSDMAPFSPTRVIEARANLAWRLTKGAQPNELFRLCDDFVTLLSSSPHPEQEAIRAHRVTTARRRFWADHPRASAA